MGVRVSAPAPDAALRMLEEVVETLTPILSSPINLDYAARYELTVIHRRAKEVLGAHEKPKAPAPAQEPPPATKGVELYT